MHRLHSTLYLLLAGALFAAGCSDSDDAGSGGSGGAIDAGAGPRDAGSDSGPKDAGQPDAGQPDAGQADAAQADAGTDAGTADAATPDAGTDAGPVDSGPPPCANASECDDGLWCNGAETCDPSDDAADGRGCVAGAPPDCSDGFACSDDSCDEDADSCVNTENDSRCDDHKFCDGVEVCDVTSDAKDSRGCVDDPVDPCDDGVMCTADACNDFADACINTPLHVRCGNGLYCDGPEVCDPDAAGADAMGCTAGTSPCDDAMACTVDTCDEANDICHNELDSDCDAGVCDTCDDGGTL